MKINETLQKHDRLNKMNKNSVVKLHSGVKQKIYQGRYSCEELLKL